MACAFYVLSALIIGGIDESSYLIHRIVSHPRMSRDALNCIGRYVLSALIMGGIDESSYLIHRIVSHP